VKVRCGAPAKNRQTSPTMMYKPKRLPKQPTTVEMTD
jgi:hypothetical protein